MADIILIIGFLAGAYMAWNIGANDVANGMASAVGAKAITLRQAVFIGGILDFVGAAFIGSHVTTTIRKNILDASAITSDPNIMMLGLLAALLAAAFWVFFSTWSQFPVSTTHSIVGALLGFGIVAGGLNAVHWGKVVAIVISWILSPIFAGFLACVIFIFIRKMIFKRRNAFVRALVWSPLFGGVTVFIVVMSFLLKTPLGKALDLGLSRSMLLAAALGTGLGFAAKKWLGRTIRKIDEEGVEEIFRRFQVFTSCYVALAHGANDVANAIGPLAGIYAIYTMHTVSPKAPVPWFLLVAGGLFIAIGVFTWGYRVIETVGSKITTLTNTRGFAVDFGTATSVLVASKMGLPVSTTHAAVGAVIGVGLAGGLSAVDFKVVGKIVVYWVITLPLAAIPTMLIFKLLTFVFL
ncbi:inorganic phosphate transporter, PiT family [Desulfacinum hydrothermale DSM 13146]|uniref:Phosphate transporter n=1 Tax=Desulfacinum hydrothermale DSM 13146 TaxID=1121390 RepID=A0A1W1X4B3_9BACT|nr:inorganic phosphate transporter [Desulfacinum hydrothermale]SMC18755.1 inorganic phosphate transporter, PiT family [Desulfacinum hydrothermale DSM 13146]